MAKNKHSAMSLTLNVLTGNIYTGKKIKTKNGYKVIKDTPPQPKSFAKLSSAEKRKHIPSSTAGREKAMKYGVGLGTATGTAAAWASGLGPVASGIPIVAGGITGAAIGDSVVRTNPKSLKKHLKKNWKRYALVGGVLGGYATATNAAVTTVAKKINDYYDKGDDDGTNIK